MQKKFKTILVLGLLAACRSSALGQTTPMMNSMPRSTITVRVHDYVGVPPKTLAHARHLTSEILLEAGVEIVWLECYPVPVEKEPGCAEPMGPLDFMMNVVDQIQLLSPNDREIAMGLAVVPSDGTEGNLVYLSPHQAIEAALRYSVPYETMLGLGAAHEIGHLLLGPNAHTASGLMKAKWGANELKGWYFKNPSFAPEQVGRIQSNLEKRKEQAEESTNAMRFDNTKATN